MRIKARSILVCAAAGVVTAAAVPSGHAGTHGFVSKAAVERARVPVAAIPNEVVVTLRPGPARVAAIADIRSGAASVRATPSARVVVARPAKGASVAETVSEYRRLPGVIDAEPNLIRYQAGVPNDPLFPEQWGLHNVGQSHGITDSARTAAGTDDADIDAPEAWDVTSGDPDTVIAVMDGGVDVTHPDLRDSIWQNPGEIPGNGIDDDRNGFVDDVNGWDFADNDDSLLEPDPRVVGHDHGTHVAATIAATANDATGVAGVCPSCKVMVLKIGKARDIDGDGTSELLLDLASELAALDYAASMGADVVNASFGAPVIWSTAEWRAYRRAGSAGVLSVVASGNLNGDNDMFLVEDFDGDEQPDAVSPVYPASYDLDSLVSVAATNHLDEYGYSTECALQRQSPEYPCTFSNWGRHSVDVAAPGVDVLSAVPGSDYARFDGTSMAAPHVSGIAGLVLSRYPGVSPDRIKAHIRATVDRPPGLETLRAFPGRAATGSFSVTDGRVNAATAVTTAPSAVLAPASDDNIAGAKLLRRRRGGRVGWPGDVNDVYRKRLRRGSRYRVVLDGPGGKDIDLLLWKPRTKGIWQFQAGCFSTQGACKLFLPLVSPSGREAATVRIRRSGVYFFQVSTVLFQRGRYTLKVRKLD